MSILSSTLSIARYAVQGEAEGSIMELVRRGVTQNVIMEDSSDEVPPGWVPHGAPYYPDFETYAFTAGHLFVFSLRIDKRSIPDKVVQKYAAIEIRRQLKETGRDSLSRNEKRDIKDMVIEKLMSRALSVPSFYDVLWDYEEAKLLFFTTQKAANEELVTLFHKSFGLRLIPLFPYTMVETNPAFTALDRDRVALLTPDNCRRWFNA